MSFKRNSSLASPRRRHVDVDLFVHAWSTEYVKILFEQGGKLGLGKVQLYYLKDRTRSSAPNRRTEPSNDVMQRYTIRFPLRCQTLIGRTRDTLFAPK